MSLIEEKEERFERLSIEKVPDTTGGRIETYIVIGSFFGSLSQSTAPMQVIGDSQRAPKQFKLWTDRAEELQFGELIRRAEHPEQIYKVVDRTERETPASATMDLRNRLIEEVI